MFFFILKKNNKKTRQLATKLNNNKKKTGPSSKYIHVIYEAHYLGCTCRNLALYEVSLNRRRHGIQDSAQSSAQHSQRQAKYTHTHTGPYLASLAQHVWLNTLLYGVISRTLASIQLDFIPTQLQTYLVRLIIPSLVTPVEI